MPTRFPATLATIVVAALWLGLGVGVSGIATPAKFLAPSLSLPAALDVGRHTFAVFNRIEWLIGLALLVLGIARGARPGALIGPGAALALLAAETFWLLPELDLRVERVLQGGPAMPSGLHHLYVLGEGAKWLVLAGTIAGAWRATGTSHAHSGEEPC